MSLTPTWKSQPSPPLAGVRLVLLHDAALQAVLDAWHDQNGPAAAYAEQRPGYASTVSVRSVGRCGGGTLTGSGRYARWAAVVLSPALRAPDCRVCTPRAPRGDKT